MHTELSGQIHQNLMRTTMWWTYCEGGGSDSGYGTSEAVVLQLWSTVRVPIVLRSPGSAYAAHWQTSSALACSAPRETSSAPQFELLSLQVSFRLVKDFQLETIGLTTLGVLEVPVQPGQPSAFSAGPTPLQSLPLPSPSPLLRLPLSSPIFPALLFAFP